MEILSTTATAKSMNESESIAYQYLRDKDYRVVKNTRSPDFIGDGTFEVKRVYLDRHGQSHVVLSRPQYEEIKQMYPEAHYLFVSSDRGVTKIPINTLDSSQSIIRAGEQSFTLHWTPKWEKEIPKSALLKIDDVMKSRIETIQAKTGILNITEIFRYALTQEYNRLAGSPNPARSRK